jgi:hypothetical protein
MARAAVLAFSAAIAVAPLAALMSRSWRARVAVDGHSMEPTLAAGDWLLVDPDAYRLRTPQPAELVIAVDPRQPTRLIIKRAVGVNPDGSLRLSGDHPAHLAEDALASVPPTGLRGRPWLRYWPISRLGRVR